MNRKLSPIRSRWQDLMFFGLMLLTSLFRSTPSVAVDQPPTSCLPYSHLFGLRYPTLLEKIPAELIRLMPNLDPSSLQTQALSRMDQIEPQLMTVVKNLSQEDLARYTQKLINHYNKTIGYLPGLAPAHNATRTAELETSYFLTRNVYGNVAGYPTADRTDIEYGHEVRKYFREWLDNKLDELLLHELLDRHFPGWTTPSYRSNEPEQVRHTFRHLEDLRYPALLSLLPQELTQLTPNLDPQLLKMQALHHMEKIEPQVKKIAANLSKKDLSRYLQELINHYNKIKGYLPGLVPEQNATEAAELESSQFLAQNVYGNIAVRHWSNELEIQDDLEVLKNFRDWLENKLDAVLLHELLDRNFPGWEPTQP